MARLLTHGPARGSADLPTAAPLTDRNISQLADACHAKCAAR
jgi:hypothetical protein